MKNKLLTLCLLSVNILAASSEAPEGSGGAAGGAVRPVITKGAVMIMSNRFDDKLKAHALTKYSINDILENRSRPRSNSAFSRLGALSGKDRKHYAIDKELDNGPRELGVKYFAISNENNELHKRIEELEEYAANLKSILGIE